MRPFFTFAMTVLSLPLLIVAVPVARAQLTGKVYADISHPFIVVNTTLPPGKYVFQMIQGSDLGAMKVTSANGATSVEFLVRQAIDNHIPKRTDLFFNRYGKTEILKSIYFAGNKYGEALVDPSREEARLQKEGDKPFGYPEEQAK
jgi:hypothetical protein